MSIAKVIHLPTSGNLGFLFERSAFETGFHLTVEDRVGIERLLRDDATRRAPNPPLLNGLLRLKLRVSRGAVEPASDALVVAGCHVTYMTKDDDIRFGVLTMSSVPGPNRILVASLLGATLIGMRKHQKVPLLQDDGQIETVVVLDVCPPLNDAA